MGLEPTSGCWPLPAFQAGSSSGRLASVAAPTSSSSGGWNRTNGLLVQSQASLPAATTPDRSSVGHPASVRSSGRRGRTSVSWVKARRPTASRSPITSSTRSALRESNPPSQLGRLGPLPIGQGHVRRKERESNPQGSSLVPTTAARRCPRAGCRRQSACPSTLSCGGRNRTCAGAVNSRLPVPARVPPQSTSWARCNRTELSKSQEHRAGVEPALPHYGCGVVAAGPPVLVVFSGTGRT